MWSLRFILYAICQCSVSDCWNTLEYLGIPWSITLVTFIDTHKLLGVINYLILGICLTLKKVFVEFSSTVSMGLSRQINSSLLNRSLASCVWKIIGLGPIQKNCISKTPPTKKKEIEKKNLIKWALPSTIILFNFHDLKINKVLHPFMRTH